MNASNERSCGACATIVNEDAVLCWVCGAQLGDSVAFGSATDSTSESVHDFSDYVPEVGATDSTHMVTVGIVLLVGVVSLGVAFTWPGALCPFVVVAVFVGAVLKTPNRVRVRASESSHARPDASASQPAASYDSEFGVSGGEVAARFLTALGVIVVSCVAAVILFGLICIHAVSTGLH